MSEPKNRAGIARKNAGLSIGQAAKLLGVSSDDLAKIEVFDSAFADADQQKLADLYRVRIEWLTGEVPRRDYAAVDKLDNADKITAHDRDIVAEFAASLPRK